MAGGRPREAATTGGCENSAKKADPRKGRNKTRFMIVSLVKTATIGAAPPHLDRASVGQNVVVRAADTRRRND